jgi:hypothetical protein
MRRQERRTPHSNGGGSELASRKRVNPRADPLRLLNERLVTNRDPDSGFPLSNSASPNSIGYPSLIVKHAIEDVEPIAFHARFDLRSNGNLQCACLIVFFK